MLFPISKSEKVIVLAGGRVGALCDSRPIRLNSEPFSSSLLDMRTQKAEKDWGRWGIKLFTFPEV